MSHRLELPPELQALIEKREQADRRQAAATPADDAATAAPPESDERRQGPRRTDEQLDEQTGD
jgi:hypothetical protein